MQLGKPPKHVDLVISRSPFVPDWAGRETAECRTRSRCLVPLKIVVAPASRGAGSYEARLDGEDHVWCVSRMPFLDAARALIAAGHDADAILEMCRPGTSSWDLRAPLQIAAQLDVAETPSGPKFVGHRRPIQGCMDCNRSTAHARPTPLGH